MHLTLVSSLVTLLSVADAGAPVAAPTPPPPAKPTAAVTITGLKTPESVFYDADTDTYLVSNINGGNPLEKDNNGFIAEYSADGKEVNAKLVSGGGKGSTLHAPKGTAVVNGVIYVADIDTVRMFDRKTGAGKGEVAVAGATFLNDVFALGTAVYVTDSGMKGDGKGGFAPTGTDGIYVIETKGKKPVLKTVLKSKDLKGPNGIWVAKDTIWVVTFSANELQSYDLAGKKKGEPVKLPKGGLDGLAVVGDDVYVSSWEAGGVFKGTGGTFTQVVGDIKGPADFAYDTKHKRLVVPYFMEDKVEAWDVK